MSSDLEITDQYGDTLRFRDCRDDPRGHITAFVHPASADRAALRVGVVLDDDDLTRLRDWLTEALGRQAVTGPECGAGLHNGVTVVARCNLKPGHTGWHADEELARAWRPTVPPVPLTPAENDQYLAHRHGRPYTDAELARGQDDTRDQTLTLALLADRITALEQRLNPEPPPYVPPPEQGREYVPWPEEEGA